MNCKVCGSTSAKNPSVSFFRFPKENSKCREWAERCGLMDLYEKHGTLRFYKSFRICSHHFDSKDVLFDGRKKRLLQSATPQISVKTRKSEAEDSSNKNNFKQEETSKVNLVENMCRLCATENQNLIDIFGWKGRVLNLESKLKYFPLKIDKNDELPLKMCHLCMSKVNQFHDFIINCFKAERKLQIISDQEMRDTCSKRAENQEKTLWDSEVESGSTKTPNLFFPTKICDLPNMLTCFPGNIEDEYYDKVLQDNFLNKSDGGCFWKQPQPDYAKTNQLISHTNFIKDVDFSVNISFDHDYSNIVSRDQLLSEPEIQSDNDQNFVEETTQHCDICLESFCSAQELNSHALTHLVKSEFNRELVCRACNKVFISRFELDEHSSVHAERKLASKICDKKFHKVAFLEKRLFLQQLENSCDCFSDLRPSKINSESEAKTGKCARNELSLFHALSQKKPQSGKIHFKSQKRSCQYCDRLFKNRQVCLAHERSHTGRTPYQCKECGKAFRSRPSLRQHRSVHSDRRLHGCRECGMSFKRKDTLSNHMRIHTGERPYVCKVCGFAFKQRGDCKKHEKNHQKNHGGEVEESSGPRVCGVDSSTVYFGSSAIGDGVLWTEQKTSSPPSNITISEENSRVGSLEDMAVHEMIPFNF